MKSRLKVLFFIAMILNLSTEISGARENDIAKANVKQGVMEKIGRGENVNQGHINEFADIETAKLAGKHFEELLAEGWSVEDATDMVKLRGLAPYGRIYNEARLHGSHKWETHAQKIRDRIEKKQLAGEEIEQQHFDELAARETERLRHKEHGNLLNDGYPPELAMRLIYERGLMNGGEVYDKLRKPHINLRTGSALPVDLTISKKNMIESIEDARRRGLNVAQKHIDNFAAMESSRLINSLYDKMIHGLDEGTALALVKDRGFHGQDEIYQELRKPSVFMKENFPDKGKERFRPGGGSSSSGH